MKLSFIEIAGFRGFREKTRLDIPAGFAVLTGRNGAGKSTVLDAIDFALTGTIDKFPVRTARGGGLDQHIWWVGKGGASQSYVSIGIKDDDGREFVVTRTRSGGFEGNERDLLDRLCTTGQSAAPVSAETFMRTTLIRDETIVALSLDLPEQQRFAAVRAAIGGLVGPDYSPRARAIRTAAEAARDNQRLRAREAQDELSRALSELTEARSAAERSADVANALRVVEEIVPAQDGSTRERAEAARAFLVERKRSLDSIETAIEHARTLALDIADVTSTEAVAAAEAAEAEHTSLMHRKADAEQVLSSTLAHQTAEQELDSYAANLTALLAHGTAIGLQEGHCPLCDAYRTDAEFQAAVDKARQSLASRGKRLEEAAQAVTRARETVNSLNEALAAVGARIAEATQRHESIRQQIEEVRRIFADNHFEADPTDPDSALTRLLAERDKMVRFERALFTLESSLAADRIATLEARTAKLRENVEREARALSAMDQAVENARQIESSAQSVANQILTEQFDTVMPSLKEFYRRLHPHAGWREIESDFGGKVRASLNFTVGDGYNVQFLFSSGQRRAAGLAFLLAIHMSRRWCNLQSLLLDDPVQHIDDYRALNLVEVLAAIRRTGRQVIVAVEDPALADLLCRRLRSATAEFGRRFDMRTSTTGSAEIEQVTDITPMPREVLQAAQ
jgi:chromosome segregation protein